MTDKVISIEQAKQMANSFITQQNKEEEATRNSYKEILGTLDNVLSTDSGDSDEIATLMSLPDDQFAVLAPVFLTELEKSYNNPNDQLALAQLINAQGLTIDEAQNEYMNLIQMLDNPSFSNIISKTKIDFLKELMTLSYNAIAESNGIAKRVINIPIEFLSPDAKMPAYAHASDAGMDVYALEDITIAPGETRLIPLGIKVALPLGYELQVRPKSGRCLKTKLRVANTPGTIDSGYRDEIGVIIDNIDSPIRKITPNSDGSLNAHSIEYGASYTIGKGEKFAQLVLATVPHVTWTQVDRINSTDDRGGGFGSTGLT